MSENDINLVPQEVQQKKKKTDLRKFLQVGSLLLFVIVIGVATSLLLFNLSQRNSIAKTKANAEKEQKVLSSQLSTVQLVLTVEGKVKALQEIFGKRKYYSHLMGILPSLLPEGMNLDRISVIGDRVQTHGNARGMVDVAKFLKVVIDPDLNGDLFSSAQLNSVSLDRRSAKSEFSIDLILKPGALSKP